MKRTNRGFAIFGEIKDSQGHTIRIQRSSSATVRAVWIFCDETEAQKKDRIDWQKRIGEESCPAPHLTKAQAKRVIAALQKFVDGKE